PAPGPEEPASRRRFATTRAVILDCCHVTRPRASWVSEPCADDPDRHTPSTCDTTPVPSSSLGACRVPLLRRAVQVCADGRGAPVLRAIRLRSPSAADRFFGLPCDRST